MSILLMVCSGSNSETKVWVNVYLLILSWSCKDRLGQSSLKLFEIQFFDKGRKNHNAIEWVWIINSKEWRQKWELAMPGVNLRDWLMFEAILLEWLTVEHPHVWSTTIRLRCHFRFDFLGEWLIWRETPTWSVAMLATSLCTSSYGGILAKSNGPMWFCSSRSTGVSYTPSITPWHNRSSFSLYWRVHCLACFPAWECRSVVIGCGPTEVSKLNSRYDCCCWRCKQWPWTEVCTRMPGIIGLITSGRIQMRIPRIPLGVCSTRILAGGCWRRIRS